MLLYRHAGRRGAIVTDGVEEWGGGGWGLALMRAALMLGWEWLLMGRGERC